MYILAEFLQHCNSEVLPYMVIETLTAISHPLFLVRASIMLTSCDLQTAYAAFSQLNGFLICYQSLSTVNAGLSMQNDLNSALSMNTHGYMTPWLAGKSKMPLLATRGN
jgi:hypothetical protein